MFRRRCVVWLLCAGSLSLGLGCGREKPIRRAAVRGAVTWNQEPIEEGTIVFVPAEGTPGAAVGVPIIGGEYATDAVTGPSVGTNRIEVYATRKTGKTVAAAFPAEGEIDVVEQYIPAQHNQKSTQTFDVAEGDNQFDLDLTE